MTRKLPRDAWACFAALSMLAAGAAAAAPAAGEWAFRALLDGRPIGEHRFSVVTRGDEREVRSSARFAVKVFGITAYRYRHDALEEWRGECLRGLDSSTDSDGTPSSVRATADADGLAITTADGVQTVAGCVMSFAYWDPAIRAQAQLLNAQTGRLEAVQISRAGSGTIAVRGLPVAATRWRISGPAEPVDVWYSESGAWIGLDSTVRGGRKLSYRLE